MTLAKGLKSVSMIIAVCGTYFCSFVADKRRVRWDKVHEPEVDSDNFHKIVKVNDKVILGMTGLFYPGETLVAPLDVYPNKEGITLRQAEKATVDYFERVVGDISESRFYFIGGKDNKGNFGIYQIYFDRASGKIVSNYLTSEPPANNFVMSVALPPSYRFQKEIREAQVAHAIRNSSRHDELLDSLGNIIKDVSEQDTTVGKKIEYLSVF